MHLPDGVLSTPVWVALDLACVPAVAWSIRAAENRARAGSGDRLPRLGLLGAFVLGAQTINFPIAMGTSAHLVGGALLAMLAGPAEASLVMTAVLLVQALVLNDGGVLALGANILNMAFIGVWVGYLPYYLLGATRLRRSSVFLGAFVSVLTTGLFAITQLAVSGLAIPRAALYLAIAPLSGAALLEALITMAVFRSVEASHGNWIRHPPLTARGRRAQIQVGHRVTGGGGKRGRNSEKSCSESAASI